jgi:hypothetical protein
MGENIKQQNLNDKFIYLVTDVISIAWTVILFCKGLLVKKLEEEVHQNTPVG